MARNETRRWQRRFSVNVWMGIIDKSLIRPQIKKDFFKKASFKISFFSSTNCKKNYQANISIIVHQHCEIFQTKLKHELTQFEKKNQKHVQRYEYSQHVHPPTVRATFFPDVVARVNSSNNATNRKIGSSQRKTRLQKDGNYC